MKEIDQAFDIEIFFGLPVTGSFIAVDGRITSITLPDRSTVTFQGRTPWTRFSAGRSGHLLPAETQIVLLVRDKLEWVYEDEIASTEEEFEAPSAPIRIGVVNGVAM